MSRWSSVSSSNNIFLNWYIRSSSFPFLFGFFRTFFFLFFIFPFSYHVICLLFEFFCLVCIFSSNTSRGLSIICVNDSSVFPRMGRWTRISAAYHTYANTFLCCLHASPHMRKSWKPISNFSATSKFQYMYIYLFTQKRSILKLL